MYFYRQGTNSSVLYRQWSKISVLCVRCTLPVELRDGRLHCVRDCTLEMELRESHFSHSLSSVLCVQFISVLPYQYLARYMYRYLRQYLATCVYRYLGTGTISSVRLSGDVVEAARQMMAPTPDSPA